MTIAVYPGTFDPITYGHEDIIKRASNMFDNVVVAVGTNIKKNTIFSPLERLKMVKDAIKSINSNITAVTFDGLIIDCCKKLEAKIIVRGIRAVSDLEIELAMAQTNTSLSTGEIDTVFIPTNSAFTFLSSTLVRELIFFGADLKSYVDPNVEREMINYSFMINGSK